MQTIDFHQHLWPEGFAELLARRERPPFLRGSVLEVPGEGTSEVDLGAHDLRTRLELMDAHGIDVSVVSLAPTLGIAGLEEDEAAALVTAYEQGILELATASAGRLVPLAAGAHVEGFAGACVGAPALLELERQASWLDELERRGVLLFVHPGPGGAQEGAPPWWPAVVEYTAQMQAAYAMWLAEGAERWPGLRIVFAILAGGGPFQLERLQSRGISARESLHDNVFFETASYGRRALELSMSTFGVGQLLFGSDAPVLDPAPALDAVRGFGEAVTDALCRQNPARLLARGS
ncbi:MAG TPA: amidohydrolase family protein [Gaiellaceae bacterium]|nr:amidohydrolase family protein [Gaiellaceae bacterium]